MKMNTKLYLESSKFIDSDNKIIQNQAAILAKNQSTDVQIAKTCFEYVRDSIKHSWYYKINPVTCKASDVLKYQTGYCYAKSHLLAALLRAHDIPSGLCYQRLSVDGNGYPFCLHGLNAIYLKEYGWYRVDASGSHNGVTTVFNPPYEQLVFQANHKLEMTFTEIWYRPLEIVTEILTSQKTYLKVHENLPDIEIISKTGQSKGMCV